MSPERPAVNQRKLLRITLLAAGIAWGSPLPALVLSQEQMAAAWRHLGATVVPTDPYVEYWLRMMGGLCGILGAVYLAAAWRPERFRPVLPILGGGLVLLGVGLTFHGARLGVTGALFVADLAFCFVCGGLILLWRRAADPWTGEPGVDPPTEAPEPEVHDAPS